MEVLWAVTLLRHWVGDGMLISAMILAPTDRDNQVILLRVSCCSSCGYPGGMEIENTETGGTRRRVPLDKTEASRFHRFSVLVCLDNCMPLGSELLQQCRILVQSCADCLSCSGTFIDDCFLLGREVLGERADFSFGAADEVGYVYLISYSGLSNGSTTSGTSEQISDSNTKAKISVDDVQRTSLLSGH